MGAKQSQREETGGSCIIKAKIGTAHGILLRTTEKNSLETHLGLKSECAENCTVVLITNHHVIPNIIVARDCTILNGKEEINLSNKDLEMINCISCCGYHGILGKYEHLKSESGEGDDCPFQLDFTILFLDTSECRLTTNSLRGLQFLFNYYNIKSITDLLKNKLECIQRTDDGGINSCDLILSEKQNNELYDTIDNQDLEKEVKQYNNLATFTTRLHHKKKIKEGSSGAPIFACEAESASKELVAIHRLTRSIINPRDSVFQELAGHKHTSIFWILQVIAIYQESEWSKKLPLTLHLALIKSVDFSKDLIDDSAVIKSLKFISDVLTNNNNMSEDFDESASVIMGVLAASLRKAIEKRKVAHLLEMIDVIVILLCNYADKLSPDARHCVMLLFNELDDYRIQDDKYLGLLRFIQENYECLGLEEIDYQQMPHVVSDPQDSHIHVEIGSQMYPNITS